MIQLFENFVSSEFSKFTDFFPWLRIRILWYHISL